MAHCLAASDQALRETGVAYPRDFTKTRLTAVPSHWIPACAGMTRPGYSRPPTG